MVSSAPVCSLLLLLMATSCLQYKTADIATRCSNLVRVNVYKDQVANTGRLPSLPGQHKLTARLSGPYHRLAGGYHKTQGKAMYAMPAPQLAAAAEFQQVGITALAARLFWHHDLPHAPCAHLQRALHEAFCPQQCAC